MIKYFTMMIGRTVFEQCIRNAFNAGRLFEERWYTREDMKQARKNAVKNAHRTIERHNKNPGVEIPS